MRCEVVCSNSLYVRPETPQEVRYLLQVFGSRVSEGGVIACVAGLFVADDREPYPKLLLSRMRPRFSNNGETEVVDGERHQKD